MFARDWQHSSVTAANILFLMKYLFNLIILEAVFRITMATVPAGKSEGPSRYAGNPEQTARTGLTAGSDPVMSDLERQMMNYRLTTAEILYHMPDHPDLLQTFIWQTLDIAPRYPVLRKFLDFWEQNIEGRLHSVRIGQRGVIAPAEFRMADTELVLH